MIAVAAVVSPPAPCPSGIYGLAGDWGAGSLLADTPHNRQVIHRRYGYGGKAWRIIHNIPPPRCSS